MSEIAFGNLNARRWALVLVEHLVIVLAVALVALAQLGVPRYALDASTALLWRASLIAAVLQVCLHYCDLYDLRTLSDRRDLFTGLLQALGAASVVLALLYYWIPNLIIGRGVFVLSSLLIVGFVGGWRIAFEWLSLRVGPAERLLIVGTNYAAIGLARELFDRRQELGVELVGFVDPDPARVGMPIINPGVIGTVAEIPQIVRERRVDRVVVSLADARGKLSMDELLAMKMNQGVRFDHLASVYEQYTGKIAVENLRPSWMIFSAGFRKSRALGAAKRAFDVGLALVGLLIAGPIMAIVAVAIRLSSPGPVLYHQQRVGKDGRTFTIHKFRSMRVRRRSANRRCVGEWRRRSARDQGWTIPPSHQAGRGAAALECADRRHELRRPAARAARVRRRVDRADSLLRPAPRRSSWPHRVGAGPPQLRRHGRGCRREAPVRALLHQAPLVHVRSLHRARDGQDGAHEARFVVKLTILGTGYVGLVSGACLADFGHDVTCVDTDGARIEQLNHGHVPFFEPGLAELVERHKRSDRLRFTTDLPEAVSRAEVVFLAVGTPAASSGEADISQVLRAVSSIAPHLASHAVIVTKSTVPVGTGAQIRDLLARQGTSQSRPEVVSNPEFLREGSAIADFLRPDRVVIGTDSPRAGAIMHEIYRPLYLIETPIIFTSVETAEMIKYASNAFLAVKISFINEVANLCERTNADVHVVAKAMGLDKRIGGKFLHPGPGYGGSCFPKDTRALAALGARHGVAIDVVSAAIAANERQRALTVQKIARTLEGLDEPTVALLGLAFKPNTSDIRESPAWLICRELLSTGCRVRAFDPAAMDEALAALGTNGERFECAADAYGAAEGADVLVIATEWNEFRSLDLARLRRVMRQPAIVDARNVIDPAAAVAAGFTYAGIGRTAPLMTERESAVAKDARAREVRTA